MRDKTYAEQLCRQAGSRKRLLEVRGKLAMLSLKQGLRGLRGYEMRKEMGMSIC